MRAATLMSALRARILALIITTALALAGGLALMPTTASAVGVALAPGANGTQTISGKVEGSGGPLLRPISIYQYRDSAWVVVNQFYSAKNGTYTSDDLGPGDYRVYADGQYSFISEFYDNVQTGDVNDPGVSTITLDGTSADVTNINFDLEAHLKYSVSGTILTGPDAPPIFAVSATRPGESFPDVRVYSEPSGDYTIDLRPGTYTLSFDSTEGVWETEGKTIDIDVVDSDLFGKDISISKAPDFERGTVRGAVKVDGRFEDRVSVALVAYEGGAWVRYEPVLTDENGEFVIDWAIVAPNYTVVADLWDGRSRYYGGGTTEPASATNLNSFPVRKGQTFDVGVLDFSNSEPPFTKASTPVIAGKAAVGSKLTVSLSRNAEDWDPPFTSLTYQWLRNGAPINSARSSSYTPVAADRGARISAAVTASRSGYQPAKLYTIETAAVATGTLASPKPAIKGTAAVGKSLSVSTGRWTSGTKLTYRWYRGTSAISGATSKTYVPKASDIGKTFTVKVTGTKSGFTTASKTSSATRKVAKGTLTAPTPKIKGSVKVGSTLKASAKGWKPSSVRLKYQWLANGKKLAKATRSTYKISEAARGKRITVRVTGSKDGYKAAVKTSRATSAVR